jgi:hypothetical protein
MSYDDSALAIARGMAGIFKCLMCGRPMRDAGGQWECRCGFFYKPLVPGLIPKRYRQEAITIKKLCRGCGRREVRGRQIYCAKCAAYRQRRSKRLCARARRSLDVDKLGNSAVGAEALTNAI